MEFISMFHGVTYDSQLDFILMSNLLFERYSLTPEIPVDNSKVLRVRGSFQK